MKLPSHVKIKNKVVYEVVFVEKFKDPKQVGECRFDQKQIAIKIGLSPRQTIKTFYHEILHSVAFERNIDISHKAIYQFEDAIYYILFHNKWDLDE